MGGIISYFYFIYLFFFFIHRFQLQVDTNAKMRRSCSSFCWHHSGKPLRAVGANIRFLFACLVWPWITLSHGLLSCAIQCFPVLYESGQRAIRLCGTVTDISAWVEYVNQTFYMVTRIHIRLWRLRKINYGRKLTTSIGLLLSYINTLMIFLLFVCWWMGIGNWEGVHGKLI